MSPAPGRKYCPTAWTRPLQVATAVCSLVCAAGTLLQNLLILDVDLVRLALESARGSTSDAPGFLTGLRTAGWFFLAGNAVGLLALTGKTWVFWAAMLVNAAQAASAVLLPLAVFDASAELYGRAGLLPAMLAYGGAALLALVLFDSFAVFRTPWAQGRQS